MRDFAPLIAFKVRSYRFQWPADVFASWAFEMETIILGWYILVETKSVLLLTGSARLGARAKAEITATLLAAGGDAVIREPLVRTVHSYAFAVLHAQFPEHPNWSSEKITRAVAFLNSNAYRSEIENSHYGFPYNPPGFEVALTLEEIGVSPDMNSSQPSTWIKLQFDHCFNEKTQLMDGDASDSNTQCARLYEATRLSDVSVG